MQQIIKTILNANPFALLTGSRALTLQGFKVRNEPNDIDIWVPHGTHFNLIPGMIYPKTAQQVEAELKAKEQTTNTAAVVAPAEEKKGRLEVIGGIALLLVDNFKCIQNNRSLNRQINELFEEYEAPGYDLGALDDNDLTAFGKELSKLLGETYGSKVKVASTPVFDEQELAQVVHKDSSAGVEDRSITRYLIDGIKVEVHEGYIGEVRSSADCIDGIKCSHHADIIKAKFKFIRKGSPTKDRHKDDIIFFLTANY